MIGNYFYHGTIRRITAVFGNLFNDISIQRLNAAGDTVVDDFKVGLSYESKNGWYLKLVDSFSKNQPSIQTILPRMSFNLLGVVPDSTRKLNTMNKRKAYDISNSDIIKTSLVEVPFTLSFSLSIAAKNMNDMLQIIEQILPYFRPELTVPIKLQDELNIVKDIPFILTGIQNEQDNYDSGFIDNRMIIWSLDFEVPAYLFTPVDNNALIKNVTIKIADNLDENGNYDFDEQYDYNVNPQTAQKEDSWTIDSSKTEI